MTYQQKLQINQPSGTNWISEMENILLPKAAANFPHPLAIEAIGHQVPSNSI
jgi:hypothetical protein